MADSKMWYLYRFALLPVSQEVVGLALHDLVLRDDLHLEGGDLGLDGCVLAAHDVIEGTPLPIHIVTVQPVGRELEPLALQDALTLFVHLWITALRFSLIVIIHRLGLQKSR